MRKFLLLMLTSLFVTGIQAKTIKVLFIGNSYTASNDLPSLIENFALKNGDTMIHNSYLPGGQTLQNHLQDPTVIQHISQGGWDYVVLQEQSQIPSFPDAQVATKFHPFANAMNDLVKQHNPCAKTMFFITWGRENGDSQNCPNFPPLCTYEGMDSLLTLRYTIAAEDNGALLAPVGPVWKKMRETNANVDLYSGDGSHPSVAGSFLAAATIYAVLFEKDPSLNDYNYSLEPTVAVQIKEIAKDVAWGQITEWQQFMTLPSASFDFDIMNETTVEFTNNSLNADSYAWDFGDGEQSTDVSPTHIYDDAGIYTVTLNATKTNPCGYENTTTAVIEIETTNIADRVNQSTLLVYPNPASEQLNVTSTLGFDQIQLIDITGKVVADYSFSTLTYEHSATINQLINGMYFVKVLKSNEILSNQSVIISN